MNRLEALERVAELVESGHLELSPRSPDGPQVDDDGIGQNELAVAVIEAAGLLENLTPSNLLDSLFRALRMFANGEVSLTEVHERGLDLIEELKAWGDAVPNN